MTNCWKTYYLLNMMEKHYRKYFDYIILICPTFMWNKTYQEWKYINDPDFNAIQCDQDKVDRILHFVQEIYKGTNSLVILDDCASSQDVKNRTSKLVKLAFSARHFGLSTIVITIGRFPSVALRLFVKGRSLLLLLLLLLLSLPGVVYFKPVKGGAYWKGITDLICPNT